jgi:hypothetical protein
MESAANLAASAEDQAAKAAGWSAGFKFAGAIASLLPIPIGGGGSSPPRGAGSGGYYGGAVEG